MALRKIKMKTMDGAEATALASYMFTEFAGIYPITPSSGMAELTDQWASEGKKNIWGQPVKVVEMQSEAGAVGTVHGALQAGALSTTYTASQGLLLMIPDLYKMKGQLLPGVIHVSARALAHRALSIFGDHQDIYACRQIGLPMISSHSVQESMDLAAVAHALAIEASVPVMHFFDGFRTSHELQKIEVLSQEEAKTLLDEEAVARFRRNALSPLSPKNRGGAENDDIYFQGVEAQSGHFANAVVVAERLFAKMQEITGRPYAPFTYYGHDQADRVIVAMGSVTETIKETIDTLNANGEKVGLVKVHLYRPFSVDHIKAVMPKTVKKISVLDRTKEVGATGEPLFLDVIAAFRGTDIEIVGGRYGLSSKNTAPRHIKAVFDNLKQSNPKNSFTVGINDDMFNTSLTIDEKFQVNRDYTSCLFYGLGSDGTVGANKNTIKIIGENTNNYAQGYFQYDSKKSGGVTRSHLRFGQSPIRSTYYVEDAEFVAVSVESYLFKFDTTVSLGKGGTYLLNTTVPADKIEAFLPDHLKKGLAEKEAKLYIINASGIAREIGMGNRTNTILQSAFFYLNPQILPYENAANFMKEQATKTYAKKGAEMVALNHKAIDSATTALVEVAVKKEWAKLAGEKPKSETGDVYFDTFVGEIAALRGDDLPVSAFADKPGNFDILDGSFRNEVTFKERRQVSDVVPKWLPENCISCNKCAMVCPHATIRAFALTEAEAAVKTLAVIETPLFASKGFKFRIQVDPANCVGCALCVKECPGKGGNKALKMSDMKAEVAAEQDNVNYLYKNHKLYRGNEFGADTPIGAAMLYPYFEMSGACGGCGETPYYRLITQFFGDSMTIANATGCTSIYCGSTPASPFTTNANGEGPAWANSLFEDNAEFGAGMNFAHQIKEDRVRLIMEENMDSVEPALAALFKSWIDAKGNRKAQRELKTDIIAYVMASSNKAVKAILESVDGLVGKSQWIIGGDGWAYDIGYGGLDHVMASGENVNILIVDTEVYSNTGGQSSKSSQAASIAKFIASGKTLSKKNMAAIAMTYQNVYVASVAMGANPAQTIKALKEAESYNGVSIIIAYAPCINHGIKGGLMNHQQVQREAVNSGYWQIFRFDPRLAQAGKNPLQIDFAKPDFDKFKAFLLNETRYADLTRVNAAHAEELFEKSRKDAMARFAYFQGLAASSAFGGKPAGNDANGPVAELTAMLPGINCGACGSGSCEGLAKDIVAKTKDENKCAPASADAKAKIKAYRESKGL